MEKEIKKKLLVGFSKILDKKQSVTLLCEKAGVSRATFYLYYKDLEEFTDKAAVYITEKYFRQIGKVMFCKEAEIAELLQKESLLLDETERKLLSYFAEGSNYIAFAQKACENVLPGFKRLCKEKLSEEFYRENEYRVTYCLNGIANIMFFNIVNYNEKKILFEVKQSRKIMRTVLGEEIHL